MSRHANTTSCFPARFREAYATANFSSFEALAREIDVSLRNIYRWRDGDAEPTGRNLVELARALGRDPDWFYPEDCEPNGRAA